MIEEKFEANYPTEIVKEGKVSVLVPKLADFKKHPSDYAPSKAPVFYNPVMELNRDIAVLAVQAYQRALDREISICEPLTSTGIRAVRFVAEIRGVKTVLMSDINQKAFNLATHNLHLNGLTERVLVEHMDANRLLSSNSAPNKRFDVVDIDPFGSPVPYSDSAIRALRNNGLLAATATDMAPLCGVHAKACIRKYGGKPLRTEYCHELAVRLLAGCVAKLAAKQDIGVRVVFSHCNDHYVRIYAETHYGAKKADENVNNLGYVLHCFNCLHRETVKKPFTKCIEQCPECGSQMDYAGPLWLGKIFEKQFCESMMKENTHKTFRNSRKISRLLSVAIEEVEAPITYYVLDAVSNKVALTVPAVEDFLNLLRENDFQAKPTHFNSRGIRTDAPALVMQKYLQEIVEGT